MSKQTSSNMGTVNVERPDSAAEAGTLSDFDMDSFGYDIHLPAGPVLGAKERQRMGITAPSRSVDPQKSAPRLGAEFSIGSAQILKPSRTIAMTPDVEAFCARFSPDGTLLAIATSLGTVEVYRTADGARAFTLDPGGERERRPCTALAFRPASAAELTKNVLLTGDAYGELRHWHATSGTCLSTLHEAGNQILAVAFRADGQLFASAGLDCAVRVYSEASRRLLHTLTQGDGKTTAGHSNRVFALKFHPTEPHLLVSGGWDSTVQVWDLREGRSVRSVYGPHLCGDGLDLAGSSLLTAAWAPANQLQLWDVLSTDLVATFEWAQPSPQQEACRLYTCQLGRGAAEGLIAAGGSGSNEVRLIRRSTGQVVGALRHLDKAVYSVSFSAKGDTLAVCTPACCHLLDLAQLGNG